MKYFIGYLIEGEAAKWHIKVAKDISNKFNTWNIHEKIPPHITIFRPFETENINPIKSFLNNWSSSHSKLSNMSIIGYDHFGDKVIFAKVDADESISVLVNDFQFQVESRSIVPVEDYPRGWHTHATLANYLESKQFDLIWKYVSTLPKPNFILPFNNITLFRSLGNRNWEVDEKFLIEN